MYKGFKNNLINLYYNSPYFVRQAFGDLYGLYLYKKRFGNKFREYYKWLSESQYWSYDHLVNYQIKKLRNICMEAYNHVPYYKKIFRKSGIDPSKIDLEKLNTLPVLTKEDIRKNFKAMINTKAKKRGYLKAHSSGTTGEMLSFLIPKELFYDFNCALLWRGYSWARITPGDRRVTIGGRIISNKPPYWLYNKHENQLYLSIHHIGKSKKVTDDYLDKMVSFQPVFIQGHPSGIHELAKAFQRRNKTVKMNLKAIFTTGETLFDDQRNTIEKIFNTKVYQTYGLGESVIAAFECEEHKGLHEAGELGIMQFEESDYGRKEIIGTSLRNYVMPFIRYRIEDLVLENSGPCKCGRTLPLKIKKIIGRVDDTLKKSDGSIILPVTIRMTIKPLLNNFQNYQVVQIARNNLIFKFCGSKLGNVQVLNISKALKKIFGEEIEIEFKKVSSLMTKGGKIRNVINNMNS